MSGCFDEVMSELGPEGEESSTGGCNRETFMARQRLEPLEAESR